MHTDEFRKLILKRIAQGHWHTLKKGVPKKKSPTGKAIKAIKERVPSCPSKAFFSSKPITRAGFSEADITDELRRMMKEGVIHCTNKMWWKR